MYILTDTVQQFTTLCITTHTMHHKTEKCFRELSQDNKLPVQFTVIATHLIYIESSIFFQGQHCIWFNHAIIDESFQSALQTTWTKTVRLILENMHSIKRRHLPVWLVMRLRGTVACLMFDDTCRCKHNQPADHPTNQLFFFFFLWTNRQINSTLQGSNTVSNPAQAWLKSTLISSRHPWCH